MRRFFIKKKLEVGNTYLIDGIEHNHMKNVMRMKVGDTAIFVCGDEFDYIGEIVSLSKGDTRILITDKQKNIYNPNADVTVFQALVKSDNMSLIVQKLTELGVKTLVPFESEFITSKDKFNKTVKLQDVSNQSIKQCKRSIPMKVEGTISFNTLKNILNKYDVVIFANECERTFNLNQLDIKTTDKVAIIIGSEGGFSVDEIKELTSNGAKSISLGKRILRAETAAIALTSVIMCKLGEWNYE